jgi:hypothetical protein
LTLILKLAHSLARDQSLVTRRAQALQDAAGGSTKGTHDALRLIQKLLLCWHEQMVVDQISIFQTQVGPGQ